MLCFLIANTPAIAFLKSVVLTEGVNNLSLFGRTPAKI
jgi:hypothetical protein